MNMGIDFPKKLAAAYNAVCKPLCRELNIPQTAFDILMFLANNPDYSTAGDIVNVRKIKANLVSVNVEKLAKDGYIERTNIEGDRRKIRLSLTEKAQPIVDVYKRQRTNPFSPAYLTALSSRIIITCLMAEGEPTMPMSGCISV